MRLSVDNFKTTKYQKVWGAQKKKIKKAYVKGTQEIMKSASNG